MNPQYCYIICEECGSRELANFGNPHCIICHWRLTGESPNGDVSLRGIRAAWTTARESAESFLRATLDGLERMGYSPRQIVDTYEWLCNTR